MHEASKAIKRRFNDGLFHSKYFIGNGIDIGCGPDSITRFCKFGFPLMLTVRNWEFEPDGDGQYLESIEDNTFNFLHSSHSLEHMQDVRIALDNWIRVIKPGGYLILTVPDEDMYEQGVFPSRFNSDHKYTFTIYKQDSWSDFSINILDLAVEFSNRAITERVMIHNEFYIPTDKVVDQTQFPCTTECSIEWILRKI
ncbi:MAG: methyltransferase domain-containing protein [Proteobacteria bacterium]|nr:methyltransferase domain-containing protein [Pseudomonadota bacterium]